MLANSTFSCSWYVIYRMLREHPGRTIILVMDHTREGCVIPPAGPLRRFNTKTMELSELNHFQDLGEAPLLIADSLVPPALKIPTLVVSSPGVLAKPEVRNTLKYYHVLRHYMPIPDEEEVLQMRAACFPHLDVDGVSSG